MTLMLSTISLSTTMRSASAKGKARISMNSVSSGGCSLGDKPSPMKMCAVSSHTDLERVVAADQGELLGEIPDLLLQLSLRRLHDGLTLIDSPSGDFPWRVFGYVAILAYQQDVVTIEKGYHAHAVTEGHHAVERRAAIGHLGNVLAQRHPLVFVDWLTTQCLPRLVFHSDPSHLARHYMTMVVHTFFARGKSFS